MVKLGFLYTHLRVEEKYLLDEIRKTSPMLKPYSSVMVIIFFPIDQAPINVDVLFERSVFLLARVYTYREFLPPTIYR